jgi:hypothetical protein
VTLRPALAAIAVLAWGAATPPGEAQVFGKKSAYPDGEEVVVAGRVVDPSGQGVADLEVELRASRESFSVKKMRRVDQNAVTVSARTDANGDYRIVWPWHHYYNRFVVQTLIPVRISDHMVQDHVVGEVDITDFIGNGSPVRAQVTLSDPALVQRVRDFEAALDSVDERRIYGDHGLPEQVDSYEYPQHAEETWWYFAQGTVFRFHDGGLVEIENFDPVAEEPGG